MTIMAQPWKHPDNGIYYFRREVPEDIRLLVGKREWKVSLRTRDPAQARPRFAHESSRCEEFFRNAREQLAGRPVLLSSDAHKLADRWAAGVVEGWQTDPDSVGMFLATLAGEVTPASDLVSVVDSSQAFAIVREYIQEALAGLRIPLPDRAEPVWEILVQEFYRSWCGLCNVALSRFHGDWRHMPKLNAATLQTAYEESSASARVLSISEAFAAWSADKVLSDGDSRKTQKVVAEFGAAITRFVELHGDLALNEISRLVCRDFRSNLFKLPTRGIGTRGKPAPVLIEMAAAQGLPTAELATVNKQLRALSAVLGFAHQVLGAIHENPITASGLIQRTKKAERRREVTDDKGYSLAELQSVFSSPLFRGEWKPPMADYGEALYWLPLLLAYTGARREELAQLMVADVKQAGEVWFLDLQEGEGQSLKTLSSRRKVPLHDDLIALGFLSYLHAQEPKGRLFPKLQMHKSNGYGHGFGRIWSKYLEQVVRLESAASPAHGFRHAFKSLCRESGIEGEVHDWITGHSSGNVGDTYGTNPLGRMAEELKKFPSIARIAGLLN